MREVWVLCAQARRAARHPKKLGAPRYNFPRSRKVDRPSGRNQYTLGGAVRGAESLVLRGWAGREVARLPIAAQVDRQKLSAHRGYRPTALMARQPGKIPTTCRNAKDSPTLSCGSGPARSLRRAECGVGAYRRIDLRRAAHTFPLARQRYPQHYEKPSAGAEGFVIPRSG